MFLQLSSSVLILTLSVTASTAIFFQDENTICTKICSKPTKCSRGFDLYSNLICQIIKENEKLKCILFCVDDENNNKILSIEEDKSDFNDNNEDFQKNTVFPRDEYRTGNRLSRLLFALVKQVAVSLIEENENERYLVGNKKSSNLNRHVVKRTLHSSNRLIKKGRLKDALRNIPANRVINQEGNQVHNTRDGGSDGNQQRNGNPPKTISYTTVPNGGGHGPVRTISYTSVPNGQEDREGPPRTISYTTVPTAGRFKRESPLRTISYAIIGNGTGEEFGGNSIDSGRGAKMKHKM